MMILKFLAFWLALSLISAPMIIPWLVRRFSRHEKPVRQIAQPARRRRAF